MARRLWMVRFAASSLAGLAGIMALSSAATATTQVGIIDYQGWKACYELKNDTTRIVVAPQLGGRIMEYAIGGQSIIWQNADLIGQVIEPEEAGGWPNYGGYKLWNAPQDRWGWPPDPALDSGPVQVRLLGTTGLKIIGTVSGDSGLQFVKEVYLESDSSRAVISQRLFSTVKQDLDWSVWDVTQVKTPGMAALPTNPASPFPSGLRSFGDYDTADMDQTVSIKDGVAIISHREGTNLKFGTDAPVGWAAYTSGSLLYIKRFPGPTKGETYPDEGLNAEVYISGDMGYVEVEILGPMTYLKRGGYTSFNEEWLLIPLKEPVSTPDAFRIVLAEHQSQLRSYAK